MFDWCKNYLTDRKQKTLVNGKNSDYLDVSCGVPQGSVLGPLFFIIYVIGIHHLCYWYSKHQTLC